MLKLLQPTGLHRRRQTLTRLQVVAAGLVTRAAQQLLLSARSWVHPAELKPAAVQIAAVSCANGIGS